MGAQELRRLRAIADDPEGELTNPHDVAEALLVLSKTVALAAVAIADALRDAGIGGAQ